MTWWKWTQSERLSMAALGSRDPKNLAAESYDSDVREILALLSRFGSDGCCVVPDSAKVEILRGIDGNMVVPKYAVTNGITPLRVAKNSAAKGGIVEIDLALPKWNVVRR